jgi:cytochrome c553
MKKVIFSLVLGFSMLSNANAGDIEAGKTKAATCAGCHGANGIGIADSFPNLAGQHADYIVKQLKAFKDGSRPDATMAPMAAGLSDSDMADVAAYFASLDRSGKAAASAGGDTTSAPVVAAYVADPASGKSLYEYGDKSRGITACVTCHGKDGASTVNINPNLAGQHPEYIAKQLNNFRSNARDNASMNQVASNLSDNDIADIAEFFKDPSAVAEIEAKRPAAAISYNGDIAAGKAKSATCAACHGADGNAAIPTNPKLAGQHEKYIAKQLMDFQKAVATNGDSGRSDPIMGGMVAGLSADDIQNLSAYFASQTPAPSATKTNEVGQKLYFSGDAERGITACVACHSIDGKGMGQAGFPIIAGQNVAYLKSQLAKFRSGVRGNDHNGMMRNIAITLSDEDIDALAQYMSSIK